MRGASGCEGRGLRGTEGPAGLVSSAMIRARSMFFPLLAPLLVVACGGATGRDPNTANDTNGVGPIGELVLANGGLPSLGSPVSLSGDSSGLRMHLIDKVSPVKVDGMLKEWPALTPASQAIKGSAEGTRFSGAVQYDDVKLYVAGQAHDTTFTRTRSFGPGEDHASLVLAFPSSGHGHSAHEVGFFAGKPGESVGAVRFLSGPQKGRDVPGATIVEAPAEGGYTFEASLPWSTFQEARTVRVGLRGALRYYDAEGSSVRTVLATSAGDVSSPASLTALPGEAESALIEGLLEPRGKAKTPPKLDLFIDVVGDAMKERVSVWDRMVTIVGPSYRGGREYFFRELDADIVRFEAREVTGRGKDDLLVRRRFTTGGATRETFEIWSLLNEEPQTVFSHELSVTSGSQRVTNAVHLVSREVEVSTQPAVGWDESSYREAVSSDIEPLLLPWGGIKSHTFRFDGSRFVRAKEVTQTPAPSPAGTTSHAVLPADVPTPVVKPAGDLAQRLIDQYRRDRGVSADTRARFDLEVHVAGDARPERVLLINRDILVAGPGFKGGNQYAYITLQQFADGADIREVTARDLSGDGGAEIIVRGTRTVTPAGATASLTLDVMFVYAVHNDAVRRVFAAETGREQGAKRVQAQLQFVPASDKKSFEIDVRPGKATGWTEKTYPWAQEQPGQGAVEPLLLPWGGIANVRYRWNGSEFAR